MSDDPGVLHLICSPLLVRIWRCSSGGLGNGMDDSLLQTRIDVYALDHYGSVHNYRGHCMRVEGLVDACGSSLTVVKTSFAYSSSSRRDWLRPAVR